MKHYLLLMILLGIVTVNQAQPGLRKPGVYEIGDTLIEVYDWKEPFAIREFKMLNGTDVIYFREFNALTKKVRQEGAFKGGYSSGMWKFYGWTGRLKKEINYDNMVKTFYAKKTELTLVDFDFEKYKEDSAYVYAYRKQKMVGSPVAIAKANEEKKTIPVNTPTDSTHAKQNELVAKQQGDVKNANAGAVAGVAVKETETGKEAVDSTKKKETLFAKGIGLFKKDKTEEKEKSGYVPPATAKATDDKKAESEKKIAEPVKNKPNEKAVKEPAKVNKETPAAAAAKSADTKKDETAKPTAPVATEKKKEEPAKEVTKVKTETKTDAVVKTADAKKEEPAKPVTAPAEKKKEEAAKEPVKPKTETKTDAVVKTTDTKKEEPAKPVTTAPAEKKKEEVAKEPVKSKTETKTDAVVKTTDTKKEEPAKPVTTAPVEKKKEEVVKEPVKAKTETKTDAVVKTNEAKKTEPAKEITPASKEKQKEVIVVKEPVKAAEPVKNKQHEVAAKEPAKPKKEETSEVKAKPVEKKNEAAKTTAESKKDKSTEIVAKKKENTPAPAPKKAAQKKADSTNAKANELLLEEYVRLKEEKFERAKRAADSTKNIKTTQPAEEPAKTKMEAKPEPAKDANPKPADVKKAESQKNVNTEKTSHNTSSSTGNVKVKNEIKNDATAGLIAMKKDKPLKNPLDSLKPKTDSLKSKTDSLKLKTDSISIKKSVKPESGGNKKTQLGN